MLNSETEAGQGNSKITWGDSFKANVLAAVREAKQRKVDGEGCVVELLPITLVSNADLRTLLAHQPEPGIAWRIAESDAFPTYRRVILDFIRTTTTKVGQDIPGFTWEDSFELDVLSTIQKAETAAANGEEHSKILLIKELRANGNLRLMLKCQPKKGTARRMAISDTFPKYRDVILEFITEVTGETRYH